MFNSGNQSNARISIDADITGAETTLNRLVNLLGVVRRSTDIKELNRLGSDLHYLNSSLNQLAIASGLGFAAFTAGGMKAADSLKVFKAQMAGITGSQQQANDMLKQTIALSNQLKVPLSQVTEGAASIAASLKLNGQDLSRLNEAYTIAVRLAAKKPEQGVSGAVYAINELYAGQYKSLANRFDINQSVVKAYMKETGDPLKALDKLLNDIGYTTETAIETNKTFANSFARLSESIGLLANTALTPFLDEVLIPMVDAFAELSVNLNENYPHLTRFAVGMTMVALAIVPAVRGISEFVKLSVELRKFALSSELGGGLLDIINPSSWKAWGSNSALSGIGRRNTPVQVGSDASGPIMGMRQTGGLTSPSGFAMLGTVIAGAIIGAFAATQLGPADKKYGDMYDTGILGIQAKSMRGASADQIFSDLITFLQQLVALLPQVVKSFTMLMTDGILLLLKGFYDMAGSFIQFGQLIAKLPGMGELGSALEQAGKSTQAGLQMQVQNLEAQTAMASKFADDATLWIAGLERGTGAVEDFATQINNAADKFGATQVEIYDEMQAKLKESKDKYNEDVAKENMGFWDDQAKSSANYTRNVNQAKENFDREEAQRLEDLNDRIAQIRADEAQDIQKKTVDYNRRVAEITKDFHQDQEKKLRQHQLEMQRMAEDHAHALEVAAAHLDATAIIDENYNYNLKRSRAEEDFNLGMQEDSRALQAKLTLEREHYKQSIEDLKENNKSKIEEMQADFKRETLQRQQDFDDKLKQMSDDHKAEMKRLELDHQDKLNLLDAQHNKEMDEIQKQAADKIAESLGIQRQLMESSIEIVKEWWNRVGKILATGNDPGSSSSGEQFNANEGHESQGPGLGGYAAGGRVKRTGMYHLERGEVITPASDASRMLRGAARGFAAPYGARGRGGSQFNFNFPNVKDYQSFKENMPEIRSVVIGILGEALG